MKCVSVGKPLAVFTAIVCAWVIAAGQTGIGAGVTEQTNGLHGYISFGHEGFPPKSPYSAGIGFYAAVWPLVDQPLANFQIGLPSTWILPDNSDNKDKPLAPEGTRARTWRERGPPGPVSSKRWKAAWVTGRAATSGMARLSSA